MRTVTVLFSVGVLMACAPSSAEPAKTSDAHAISGADVGSDASPAGKQDRAVRVAQDLKRLSDLKVVEINGTPKDVNLDEASVARLDAFTSAAEKAAATQADVEKADLLVGQNLMALQALNIVSVGQLVYDDPSSSGRCYGPCPPSTKAEHRRAVQLAHIAAATKGL